MEVSRELTDGSSSENFLGMGFWKTPNPICVFYSLHGYPDCKVVGFQGHSKIRGRRIKLGKLKHHISSCSYSDSTIY